MRKFVFNILCLAALLVVSASCTHQDYVVPVSPWGEQLSQPGAMVVYPQGGAVNDDVLLRIKDLSTTAKNEVEILHSRSYDYCVGDYRVTMISTDAGAQIHNPDFSLVERTLIETSSDKGEVVPELPVLRGFTNDTVVRFNQTTVVDAWQRQLTREVLFRLNIQGVDVATISNVEVRLDGLIDSKSLIDHSVRRVNDSIVYAINNSQTPEYAKVFRVMFNILGIDESTPQLLTVTISTFDGRSLSKTIDISDCFYGFNSGDFVFYEVDKQVSFAIGDNGVITAIIEDWVPGINSDIIGN